MPTAAELRAKALELRQNGVDGSVDQRSKRQAGARPAQHSSDTFEKLLKFTLFQASAMDHLQQACTLAFVIIADNLQKVMADNLRLWEQSAPPQPHANDGKWVAHPLGERRCYLFSCLIELLKETSFAQEPCVVALMKCVDEMDVLADMKLNIGNCGPRHSTPKSGRAWVWELTVTTVSTPAFKQHLFEVMAFLQKNPSADVKFEPMKRGPVGLRQSLWEDLKNQTK